MNDLQIFQNDEFGQIRTLTVEDEPWFVGKDVAVSLGYKDTVNALKSHVDNDDKRGWQITTPYGEQTVTAINESGLYSLIFSSKLDSAKRFKRWVTSEVLPSIRKYGTYSTHPDYLQAARIVATCKKDRLPVVLGLLTKAGFTLPVSQEQRVVCATELDSLMIQYKVSLRELSKRTGICKSALSYYRRGIYKPSQERYQIIVQAITA